MKRLRARLIGYVCEPPSRELLMTADRSIGGRGIDDDLLDTVNPIGVFAEKNSH